VTLLRNYLIVSVLKGVALVLVVLVLIGAIAELVGQLDDVGVARYGLNDAVTYVALRIPRMIFEVLPVAALIGALLSLGNLAVHRELVVMRASGVSHLEMLGAVGFAGVVLLVFMGLIGESLAPSLGAYARDMRDQALLDDVNLADGQSAWLRDGSRIISLHKPGDGREFAGGLMLFELDGDSALSGVVRADTAGTELTNEWILANYVETTLTDAGVEVVREPVIRQDYDLSPDLLGLSVVRQDLLDTPALTRYIAYLRSNDLDADRYLIAYWSRIANMVSVVLMTVLAVPFVLGSLRSAGAGARLLIGLLVGLGYYGLVQLTSNGGEVYDVDPVVVAWAPCVILTLVTAVALLRVR
jgi:lipopolysaccharide export system permease protein